MGIDLAKVRERRDRLQSEAAGGPWVPVDTEYSAVVGGFRKRRENLNDAIAWVKDRGGTVEARFYVDGSGVSGWHVLWNSEED